MWDQCNQVNALSSLFFYFILLLKTWSTQRNAVVVSLVIHCKVAALERAKLSRKVCRTAPDPLFSKVLLTKPQKKCTFSPWMVRLSWHNLSVSVRHCYCSILGSISSSFKRWWASCKKKKKASHVYRGWRKPRLFSLRSFPYSVLSLLGREMAFDRRVRFICKCPHTRTMWWWCKKKKRKKKDGLASNFASPLTMKL